MKKNLEDLGKSLSKREQKGFTGGLPYNCWCLTPIGLEPCMVPNYSRPCGQPGQVVVCRQEPCYLD